MKFFKFKEFCKGAQNRVRLSKSENFRRQYEKCVGDSKRMHRFLDLIRRVQKTSQNISTLKDKSGDRIVNTTDKAAAVNDYFVEIGYKLVFCLPEVEELLIRQIFPDF